MIVAHPKEIHVFHRRICHSRKVGWSDSPACCVLGLNLEFRFGATAAELPPVEEELRSC